MTRLTALLLLLATAGCANATVDDNIDSADDCVTCTDGKSDRFGFSDDPYLAEAMLDVVNTVSVDVLDDDIALYSVAASNIVAARPLETLEQLDAVKWVGLVSFNRIADYARNSGMVGFCGDEVVQSFEECDGSAQCNAQCETAGASLDISQGSALSTGTLQAGERREFVMAAVEGDAIVAHLRKARAGTWDPNLEIYEDDKLLEYSNPWGDADAHIPYRDWQLAEGFEIRHDGSYTLVVENVGDDAGEFELTVSCVAGPCAASIIDTDADGIPDISDNCVNTPNTDQTDSDANAIGDACEEGADRFPGLVDNALEQAMRDDNGWVYSKSYSTARSFMFSELDNHNGVVTCIYTGMTMNTWGVPDHTVMNTEHLWPRSKGGPESDLHHLRPTESWANAQRSSHPFGEVSEVVWSDGAAKLGTNAAGVEVFEAPANIRGDIARSLFYVAVQYKMDIDAAQEEVLRRWHEADPVDDAERARHQQIANFQDSRNLFIDQPDLVQRISDF